MQEQQDILLYQTEDGRTKIQVRLTDNTVWLTQAAMVDLFQTTKQNISLHIKHIFEENELKEDSVVKYFLTTAADGKNYNMAYYNLDVVISVGYRVKSLRGTQFRIWATERLREYLIKGFTSRERNKKTEEEISKELLPGWSIDKKNTNQSRVLPTQSQQHTMKKITIRKITIDDLDPLQDIGKRTFAETFSAHNSEENMKAYLETGFSKERLRAELTDPNAEFYFAELNGNVIGYLKINAGQSQTEIKEENALEIERIYVLKAFHGKKVGQMLYDEAISLAKQKRVDYVWLGVWEENPRAISFYRKNGFVEFDKHIFKLGHEEQTDIMMKLKMH